MARGEGGGNEGQPWLMYGREGPLLSVEGSILAFCLLLILDRSEDDGLV